MAGDLSAGHRSSVQIDETHIRSDMRTMDRDCSGMYVWTLGHAMPVVLPNQTAYGLNLLADQTTYYSINRK